MQLLIKKIKLGEEAFRNLLSIANSYYYIDLLTYPLWTWDTVRISIWLQDISRPGIFNFNPGLFNPKVLKIAWLKSPWRKKVQG